MATINDFISTLSTPQKELLQSLVTVTLDELKTRQVTVQRISQFITARKIYVDQIITNIEEEYEDLEIIPTYNAFRVLTVNAYQQNYDNDVYKFIGGINNTIMKNLALYRSLKRERHELQAKIRLYANILDVFKDLEDLCNTVNGLLQNT